MTTFAASNSFNAESSVNLWFAARLAEMPLPPFMPAMPNIVFQAQEIVPHLPCFALFHLPGNLDTSFMGGVVGDGLYGGRDMSIVEVSCYVSRNDEFWRAVQNTMRDMIKSLVVVNRIIPILDYYTDPIAPPETGYKVDLMGVTEVEVQDDPNPDVERARLLIETLYTYRASSS